MRKLFVLAIASLLALSACGKKSNDAPTSEPEQPAAAAQAAESVVKDVTLGQNNAFIMTLPNGYKYDSLNYWYASPDGKAHFSAKDVSFFEHAEDFEEAIKNVAGEGKTSQIGQNTLTIKEEKEGFNGPSSLYYINFNGQFKNYAGCMIRVSSFEGIENTQSPEILKMIESVKRYSPLNDIPKKFEMATTAAMSNFMQSGRYAADGNTVFGQAFDPAGKPEFVRFDLEKKGDSFEVKSHKVIEKEVQATYITPYEDYVFYIRAGKELYSVKKDGSNPRRILGDVSEYLQVRGDKFYWCDSSYKLKTAAASALVSHAEGDSEVDLGNAVDSVFDKEIYYAFMLDENWLIFQDDADHESLHLRHLPSGQEIALTTEASHGPVVLGSDLFYRTNKDGVETLAKMDLSAAKVSYDKDNDSYSCAFSASEYSGKPSPKQLAIDMDKYCFAGLSQGMKCSEWKDIENAENREAIAYKFVGPDFDISWEFSKEKPDIVHAIEVRGKGMVSGVVPIPNME